MTHRVEDIEGRVLSVNSRLHRPEGLVSVDGVLTVSDAALVRHAIDDAGLPRAGVVTTTHIRTDRRAWRR